jgi:uncharacterized protein (DUF362 family)/Pyruvate/2-oxoacid:ferredoxin oxidoreductase delta subunit
VQYVSIERCESYDEEKVYKALEKIINHLGGWRKFIKPGNVVALKPNLLMYKKPEEAATTHPAIIKAVITQVQKAGGLVVIAESPGGPYNLSMLKYVYKMTGVEKVASETGAILNYDLRVDTINQSNAKYLKKFEIIKPLADADVIINLPKLKTHAAMVYTGAIKNMFGAIAGTSKTDLHMRMPDYNKFADCLIDIFTGTKPTLNIMDAVIGMEGYGPTSGDPKHIGLLLASENGFSLDVTASKLIRLPLNYVPVFVQAKERGLIDEEIIIHGEQLDNIVIKDFKIPEHSADGHPRVFRRRFMKSFQYLLKPRPEIQNGSCVRCGDCVRNCPPKVIRMEQGKESVINYKDCIRCFCCQELCSHNAIKIHRNLLSKALVNKKITGLK